MPLSEHLIADRQIYETVVKDRDKPYFGYVHKDPLSFDLFLYLGDRYRWDQGYKERMFEKLAAWLDVDTYKPLSFCGNLDRVYYALPIEETEIFHNGLGQGYIQVYMRCDSPYSYSHFVDTGFYKVDVKEYIEIENDGMPINIEFSVKKIGNGELKITNMSNVSNSPVIVKNLKNEEEFTITKAGRFITDDDNHLINDDYNREYLELAYGLNRLLIEGSCYIKFKYQRQYAQ